MGMEWCCGCHHHQQWRDRGYNTQVDAHVVKLVGENACRSNATPCTCRRTRMGSFAPAVVLPQRTAPSVIMLRCSTLMTSCIHAVYAVHAVHAVHAVQASCYDEQLSISKVFQTSVTEEDADTGRSKTRFVNTGQGMWPLSLCRLLALSLSRACFPPPLRSMSCRPVYFPWRTMPAVFGVLAGT